MKYPQFNSKEEEIDFMRKHQAAIIAEKKMTIKKCDPVQFVALPVNEKDEAFKASGEAVEDLLNATRLKVRAIINTTLLFDSHKDVHIDGIWKRSLKAKRELYLLKEHKMTFETIISDEVKAYTKYYTWKELGFDYPGRTQALVFDAFIDKEENPYMFERYAKGKVKNHSVGMGYVKIGFATANDNYPAEKALWDKYINKIANKEDVEDQGYFWAVEEAKVFEGSAVPAGSNFATPTESVESSKETQDSSTKDTLDKTDSPGGTQHTDQKKGSSVFYY